MNVGPGGLDPAWGVDRVLLVRGIGEEGGTVLLESLLRDDIMSAVESFRHSFKCAGFGPEGIVT